MKRNKWLRWAMMVITVFVVVLGIIGAMVSANKDQLLAKALNQLNQSFNGRLAVEETQISPFQNFPYISIDLKNLQIFETKEADADPIVQVNDAYVGFDLWSVISGSYQIKRIKLSKGFVQLIQYADGTLNIVQTFANDAPPSTADSGSNSSVNLDLQGIELIDIDLLKLNQGQGVLLEAFIEKASSSFKTTEDYTKASLTTSFVFNLIVEGDTTFLKNKHVALETAIDFDAQTKKLQLSPSQLLIEQAQFVMKGSIDVDDDMHLDLSFAGQKPNFDLFLAFLPAELAPLVNRYDNGGMIYFDASVVGPSINGKTPNVVMDFGLNEAYIHNLEAGKAINDLGLKGHFDNGTKGDPKDAILTIQDFSAKPETGSFRSEITVKNLESPEINIQVDSDFNLEFLADFLEIDNLQNVSGDVVLKMNFRDIIDLDEPQKTIQKLDESYFTELKVRDLAFTAPSYPLPFTDINIDVKMDGHAAKIEQFNLKVGNSDIAMNASISDLPAIVHHTDIPVEVDLDIQSSVLDLRELTAHLGDSTAIDEKITDFSTRFKFHSTARALTESPHLPIGEFFIERLNAQLTNYPHRLHDFYFDILVDSTDFRIVDLNGMIDESDFHFDGHLDNYDVWLEKESRGTTAVAFNFNSSLLQLKDLFSYGGENYVPEDYQQEEFENVIVRGRSTLVFDGHLQSASLTVNEVQAHMKVHDMDFEEFKGEISYDTSQLIVRDFGGQLGHSQFKAKLTYYLGDNAPAHSLQLESEQLDFDQLFSYQPPAASEEASAIDHEEAFNVFELPFAEANFEVAIERMNYHRYLLNDFTLKGRMQTDHFVYIDQMDFEAAGGSITMDGYFNGSDPALIYFSPNMSIDQVQLEQFLFKFENFGQDQLVSDNLSGSLSGNVTGQIHMHPDMIPSVDDSELHLDIEVLDGSLNNFAAFEALSSYFTDKNLNKVRFDTLRNEFHLQDGILEIPSMNINTTLGYFELSGRQNLNQEMEYYVRIPWKVIARAGTQKLFARNNNGGNSDQIDEIQYRDETRRTRFVNVKISGTPEDYSVSLEKNKNSQ